MTTTISQASKAMQKVLYKRANEIAEKSPFFERQRQVTGSSFVRGLVFGWINDPQATLDTLSQSIGNAGTPITRQGLHKRFTVEASDFLYKVLHESLSEVVSAMPVERGLLSQFTHVELLDSSQIELPDELENIWLGSGGYVKGKTSSAIKLNVRWDVRTGELCELDLSDGRQHDGKSSIQYATMPKGSLRIADLGYWKLNVLKRIADEGSYWLTRYKTGTIICDEQGQIIDLLDALPRQVGKQVEWQVHLGKQAQIPCRLVAERVPEHVVKQRHERLDETARRRERPFSDAVYEMAKWTIYLTNVPQKMLTIAQVLALGHYRWQIELLFKLWKSELEVNQWRTQNPQRILCELYAKLIGVIVTHWLLLVGTWYNPQRSFIRSMGAIRGLAWQFANSIPSDGALQHALEALIRSLSACRLEQTKTFTPSSKQVQAA
ncbi:MAG: IS4 family transposase [Phototrophicaceae bacterium]